MSRSESTPHGRPPPAERLEAARRLWWLPLLAGGLPALGVAIAFPLAAGEGHFAPCNPLIDGCVSISRAARQGLPNHLFRALLIPGAVLQAAVWWLVAAWLRSLGGPALLRLRWVAWFGVAAGAFLVLYGAFLGTEGAWYQWLRRWVVVFYFGFTCACMVIVGTAVRRAAIAIGRLHAGARVLLALCLALPLLGAANQLAPVVGADAVAVDHFENATEWWAALVFTLFFGALAALWRQTGFAARLTTAG
jgi:hypothetical protein